ncbi:helix-turn-helix transcriptional regulator [Streptomyces humidus]|uniref:helix-turn-helix transcriptional regulator n=1 Tax=Streptomyces humidus TaxID=52259 RepID=UPI001E421630|nr:LuxR C-terminal-related transcriptional regulator [Streptomyces humidus]
MTSIESRAATPRPPWPFTGREEERELVRHCLTAGRPGIVVTGPAGCGRTRLALEAVRGADFARVTGAPGPAGVRDLPFAAFAHLLPEGATLHRAVRLLCGVRLLVVDDAHLLDDASAALVHQLAVQGRTRLLVLVADGPAPAAVSRLWSGELLPRLALRPLPREETAQLLVHGAGGPVEPLTANRLHRLCRGDLRLLRDLLDALRERPRPGRDTDGDADGDALTWRGRVPLTPGLRERAAAVLARPCPDERDALDRLAFAEPLPLPVEVFAPRVLERLEADGLLDVVDDTGVRLAHPLHGPVLRAAAGPLRARRLSGGRPPTAPALAAEAARLARGIDRIDVRATPTPVGEWLLAEGEPVPPWYAAVRARFSRLRGELREAAAWAREGMADDPHDHACRIELALALAQSGETGELIDPLAAHPGTAPWPLAARGDLDTARKTLPPPDADALDGAVPVPRQTRPDSARKAFAPTDARAAAAVVPAQASPAGVSRALASAGAHAAAASGLSHAGPDSAALASGDAQAVADSRPGQARLGGARKALAPTDARAVASDARAVASDARAAAATDARAAAATDARAAAATDARAVAASGFSHPGCDSAPPRTAGPDADRRGRHPAHTCAVHDPYTVYDAVRLGAPEGAARALPADGVLARHARALVRADGPALDVVAAELAERGLLLFAAEAYAQSARVHRDAGAARTARTRAAALARRCQGARTPALAGLALGELTARQRQIVTLAAAGLSNRQIAERLTLSVRTVGNHLYAAYTRLGAADRGSLPWLVELRIGQPA